VVNLTTKDRNLLVFGNPENTYKKLIFVVFLWDNLLRTSDPGRIGRSLSLTYKVEGAADGCSSKVVIGPFLLQNLDEFR
jgi:hypothetical protein